MARKPRLTNAVRNGWDGIRAFVTCELESGQCSQWECREAYRRIAESGDPNAELPDTDLCSCEGCAAARTARYAIAWIDARMRK